MTYKLARALVASLTALTIGCASFPAADLESIASFAPSSSQQKKSIAVILTGSVNINDNAQDAPAQFVDVWTNRAIEAYEGSGLFASVKPGLTAADLRAEISFENRGKANMALAFITGLTFFIVPSSATDTFTAKTTFKDGSGRIVGTYEKSGSMTTWTQLLLLPVLPFRFPGSVSSDVMRNIHSATLVAAQKDGIL